ncbi:MAG: hypothetical protein E6J83_16980 [Deltaproteobacteria bacterium]|nr:MAG: hypothetical protein E6J83_16980 [Deltaproteobacteria bacterium]
MVDVVPGGNVVVLGTTDIVVEVVALGDVVVVEVVDVVVAGTVVDVVEVDEVVELVVEVVVVDVVEVDVVGTVVDVVGTVELVVDVVVVEVVDVVVSELVVDVVVVEVVDVVVSGTVVDVLVVVVVPGGASSTRSTGGAALSRDEYATLLLLLLAMARVYTPGPAWNAGVTSTVKSRPAPTLPNPRIARANSGRQGEVSRVSTTPSPFVSTSVHLRPGPRALVVSSPVRLPSTQRESATG